MNPFRSFLPYQNPLGFGAADYIELLLAALLIVLVLARGYLEPIARSIAYKTRWCMALLFIMPVALRLALLPKFPIPIPSGSDDFSYLLLGDTLAHLRLANPPHPLHQFFESIFVLQQPTYASIFPLGQGIVLAVGQIIFGHPWAGVVLSIGGFCALCYWMLRAWTTPSWALVGGLLAVIEFGPLNRWMNSYWGGAVSAIAGCLVFGSLPRLREHGRTRDAIWLGLGLTLQLLTRPFEFVLLAIAALLFFAPDFHVLNRWRKARQPIIVVLLAIVPGAGLTLLQNRQVTGSWTTLPYTLSRYQYGVPTTLTFQPNPKPHRALTQEQQLDYNAQSAIHGDGPETIGTYLERLAYRIRFYRFFFLPPLVIALPAFLLLMKRYRFAWVFLCIAIFAAGTGFYPYFYNHYIAAATCLFLLVSVKSLEVLSRFTLRGTAAGADFARLILFFCAAHFIFWYGIHAFGDEDALSATTPYETWDYINYGDPEGRIAIHDRLANASGKQLVLVRYGPRHMFHGWIQNAADIDASSVVWASDLGASENEKLLQYYSGRTAWLLEPDARPPRLSPYNLH